MTLPLDEKALDEATNAFFAAGHKDPAAHVKAGVRCAIETYLAALTTHQLVPKEPTMKMVNAAVLTFIRENGGIEHAPYVTYRAMLEAASQEQDHG